MGAGPIGWVAQADQVDGAVAIGESQYPLRLLLVADGRLRYVGTPARGLIRLRLKQCRPGCPPSP
jgi:hypothetical protein